MFHCGLLSFGQTVTQLCSGRTQRMPTQWQYDDLCEGIFHERTIFSGHNSHSIFSFAFVDISPKVFWGNTVLFYGTIEVGDVTCLFWS